ncbi:MAG TPA: MarR family transcriptional regulator [Spirochaetia bacterium]|nr:MarR family transcriptional regulator [Spirochaetia bacterium]
MNSAQTSKTHHLEQLSWMFFATLRRMSRNLDIHSRHLEKEFGLTVPQLNVLWAVGASGRVPIGQIAERINLSSATLTSIVDRLEQHELVLRERSTDDKRQVLIELTDSGRSVLARGPKPFHECFEQRLGRMEHWQQTELLSAVQHIASMMDPEDAPPGEPIENVSDSS